MNSVILIYPFLLGLSSLKTPSDIPNLGHMEPQSSTAVKMLVLRVGGTARTLPDGP